MRWYWIDRFLEFECRSRALAVKTISLSENHMWDHSPGYPVMPPPLIIEGIAQTAGILVGEVYDFQEKVILAKVGRAAFHQLARPGDSLKYSVTIQDVQPHGAIISGQSHLDGELQAEVEIVFAHLDDRFAATDLFTPMDFLVMLRILGVFEVGRNADGSPLVPPEHLLKAEKQALGEAV